MNKFEVIELLKRFGSPLYVFDDKPFIDNYHQLCELFRKIYPNYNPGYSYKTNYTPHICKLVKRLGGYAEVVSDMELWVAKQCGYDNSKIIYNGPCKGKMLEEHLLNGGILNIDNEDEAKRVVVVAQQHLDKVFKVNIRITARIDIGFVSRFGIESGSLQMDRVVALLKSQENVKLVGLHMHVSRARYLSAWQERVDQILAAADRYIDGVPEIIDLGSGMFAEMEDYLKDQFTIDVPTYDEYAEVVAGTMAKHYANTEMKPLLVTEPGTTIVSRYMSLLTTITGVKEITGRNIAMCDSDIHEAGETAMMMKVPYTHFAIGEGEGSKTPIDITGFTCLEQDTLFKDFPKEIKVGDVVEFRNVGGYSVVYKPPFIQPCCAMVAIKEDGTIEEIKRRESFEDIFQTYRF